jgi:hypothetical protein
VEGGKMGDFLTVGYSWLCKTWFQKWLLLSVAVVIWLLVGTFKKRELNVEKCVKLNGTHCWQTFTHQVIRIQVEIYSTVANLMWLLCWLFFFLLSLLVFYTFGLLIFGVIPVGFIILLEWHRLKPHYFLVVCSDMS